MVNFEQLLNTNEKVNLEVKSAQNGLPNSLWETYSSFANTFGGTIILGIGEDKETKKFIPLGIKNCEKMITDIWNTLNNKQKVSANILLEHHIYKQEYMGLNYIVIEVQKADRKDKPIFIGTDMFNGTYRRNFEGDYLCSKDEIKAMLRDQSDTSADSLVLNNININILNEESIRLYRLKFRSFHEEHIWNTLPNNEFLTKIGAARISDIDGIVHPTLGGLIFFGNYIDIINELPNYFLDYREKTSNETRWTDRVCSSDADWSGNIFDFYFKIVNKLTSNIKRPFALDETMSRIDDTIIHKGVRECLANALIHADYYGRRGIVIDKELNKITISNPGTFRIGIDEAIAGGISDARNARIFNMFSLINIGERSGIGICDIYNSWKKAKYDLPIFEESLNPDRVTIYLKIEYDGKNTTQATQETTQATQETTQETTQGTTQATQETTQATQETTQGTTQATQDVNNVESRILNLLKENPTLSQNQIALILNCSINTIKYYIKKLQSKNIIKREGSSQKGKWTIIKELK